MSNAILEIEPRSSSDRQNPNSNGNQSTQTSVISLEYLPRLFEKIRKVNQLNGFYITVAYLKIIASTYGILFTNSACNQSLRIWLCMMMVYDILVIVNRVLKIEDESSANSLPNEQSSVIRENDSNLIEDSNNDIEGAVNSSTIQQNTSVQNESIRTLLARADYKAVLLRIRQYTPWYYFFLFFFGNSVIFPSASNCSTEAPFLNKLVIVYLGFQYINITIPVLVCFSILCLCSWAVGSIIFGAFSACRQRSKNKNLVNKLKVMKYPANLEGDHECSICMCQYDTGDEIIGLDCSKMHHYHSDCIKKWLKVDGSCPMCRTSLEEMKKKNKKERSKHV